MNATAAESLAKIAERLFSIAAREFTEAATFRSRAAMNAATIALFHARQPFARRDALVSAVAHLNDAIVAVDMLFRIRRAPALLERGGGLYRLRSKVAAVRASVLLTH